MASRQEARDAIARLVSRYQALTPAQVRQYNEENTKKDFVLPLFRVLGWDIDDSAEVAAEEKASGGRVDYAFKLRGVSQFYLEVKPLRADLSRPEYAKQVITYAYNKGVTWAALTDFEGLQVFNAQTGKLFLNSSCGKYATADWDDLWLLSREALHQDTLSQKAQKYGALPQRLGIEQRLYAQLRHWREELFTQLHRYNKQLTFEQIDEVIQRLFNRLIFIRTCEDRGIEERMLLAALHQWRGRTAKGELVEELRRLFRYFDGYYDSDLFSLHHCDQVFIESATLENLIEGLYEVRGGLASYDFSVIDADVLGAVYEQYLGHVATEVKQWAEEVQARLDLGLATETAFEVSDKRQKRKEQGIYYTPKWVTDYIVKQTVGRFIAQRSHNDIVNMKILDPACGSGSFLIRAYDELLNYHASQRGKAAAELDQWDRLPVLTGNIFGVDLDQQAVEVARLNLLLRSLARRETLPSLADNIHRGNSLIQGGEAELRPYFGDAWRDKHQFDWQQEFKGIMAGGGFDVVIGNPPYVRIQSLPRDEADYYREEFETAFGSFDIYVLFVEQGIKLLKPGGRLGFICSGKFLKAEYGKKLRQLIREHCTVESMVDLSALTVFAEATTYPVMVVVRKQQGDGPLRYVFVPEAAQAAMVPNLDEYQPALASQEAIVKGVWPPLAKDDAMAAKLSENTVPLGELAERVFVGLQTSADQVYILQAQQNADGGVVRVYSRSLGQQLELETDLLKPLLSGKDIARYGAPQPTQLLLFPYKVAEGKAELIPPEEFASGYPRCWNYLLQNKQALEDRERGKMRHERWYAFGRTQNLALHDLKKIAIPRLVKRLEAVYDKDGVFYLDNVDVGGLILKDASKETYLYILALINSQLLNYYFRQISVPFRGDFRSANRQFLEPLPIRRIDFNNAVEKAAHDRLVALAERMLELHEQLHALSELEGEQRHQLQREIQRTDAEIDGLVYDLYGLTEAERQIVESELRG